MRGAGGRDECEHTHCYCQQQQRRTKSPHYSPLQLRAVCPRRVWGVGRDAASGPAAAGFFPFRVRRGLLGRDGDEVAQGAEPGERLALELADALARQVELVPDRLERPRLALESEAELEDAALA